jgi:hypothetical protein
MELTPEQLRGRLVEIIPALASYSEPEEGRPVTLHGVFAQCSHYVRERYEQLTPEQKRRLGEFVGRCMTPPGTQLDNAAATCFLENLTFERFSKDFESYLDGEAREFYRRFQS